MKRLRLSDGLQRYREARILGLSVLDAMRLVSQPPIAGGMPGTAFINDLKNALVFADVATFIPSVFAATANGAAVDMVNADGNCFAILVLGVATALTSLDMKMQESDTSGGTYTDIPLATFPQQTTGSHTLVINFKRTKRFVRGVGTLVGTSVAMSCLVLGVKKSQ